MEGLEVSCIQCVGDMFIVKVLLVDIILTIKVILMRFELTSGLTVNFYKSCIYGVNVVRDFLDMGEDFLHCKSGSLTFMYLGLLVGAKPRKKVTWDPLVKIMSKRLSYLRNKFASLGWRVIMMNSI